jgi:hypothetical protein
MYYIYHIIGKKIGCSKNPNRRVNQQGYTEFEILEQHEDIDIASKRELELQQQYEYKIDNTLYKQTVSSPTIEGVKKGGQNAGKINGNKLKEEGKLKKWWSEGGKKQGPIQGNINKENGHMSRLGKQMTEYNNRIQICPYCGKESRGVGYIRWHGERCKNYSPLHLE